MLRIINKINEINAFLDKQESSVVIDYKLILKVSIEIDIYLLVSEEGKIKPLLEEVFKSDINNLIIHEIPEYMEEDYQHIFKDENKYDLGLRRRLNNFIDFINKEDHTIQKPVVATFYSYKGGLGRSTTLASFAVFCAKLKKQRVVIIDCDFEAPGFTNYFDLDDEILSQKNGVVEYLLDKQSIHNTDEQLDITADYSYKVGYEYTGEGDIYIIPAGNLSGLSAKSKYHSNDNEDVHNFEQTHRDHYLEALSRIDISSVDNIIYQFKNFISDIKQQLDPDIILFDSRTGFNDIFAVLASISKVIVGLFGNNIQNKIGLEQFLDIFGNIDSEKDIILINSLIPDLEYFENFKDCIDKYVGEHEEKFSSETEGVRSFERHYIKRESILAKIGTDFAYKKKGKERLYDVNWVNLIEENIFFQPLFREIFELTQPIFDEEENVSEEMQESIDNEIDVVFEQNEIPNIDVVSYIEGNKDKVSNELLQKNILDKLHENIPQSYADYKVPTIDDFYFRECMKDMFNRDKYLIIGSKGTGKTFLYQSFKDDKIRTKLQERSGITDDKYMFVNIVSVKDQEDNSGLDRYLETTQFGIPNIEDTDYFFERFWVIFVWNSIMLDEKIKDSKYYIDKIPLEDITPEPKTIQRFKQQIYNDNVYSDIFNVLKELDELLVKDDKNLIILFDQLDFVVKPINWSQGIAPLISFWRANPFKRILPKIFLRSDLFKNLTNLTNIQNLYSRSINIEWKKEELFAFFFKIVLRYAKNEFYLIHHAYNEPKNVLPFIQELENVAKDNQIPLEEKYLRPLVDTFFGKSADWKEYSNKFGDSYDWFFKNLIDANGNVSIRPFLDLIDKAIDMYFTGTDFKYKRAKRKKAILSSSFYSSFEAKEFSVDRYFKDLAHEKGNTVLLKVHQFIKKDGPLKFKVPNFRKSLFFELINEIRRQYRNDPEIKDKTRDEIIKLLVSNGIFKEIEETNKKYVNYNMPFLYRNYFGVSNRNAVHPSAAKKYS